MRTAFLAALLTVAGCIGSDLQTCADGRVCPSGDVCAPDGDRCVSMEQVQSCTGLGEGARCTALDVTGACQDGVCVVQQVEPFNLRVNLPGEGAGRVESEPAGVDCGATCSFEFPVGTRVVLTATPLDGSSFGGWSGPCAGTSTCELTVTSATTVGATFVLPPPPTISEIEPQTGVGIGGKVVITGKSFAGLTSIAFNGVSQPDFTVTSPTTMETTVPVGARSGPITVVGPGGSATSKRFIVLLADILALQGADAALEGCSHLELTVAQAESLPADVRVEFDPGTGYRAATPARGSPSLLHVATSPEGVVYAFEWDSTSDVTHQTTSIKLRVSAAVSNTSGSVGDTIVRDIEIKNGAELAPGTLMDAVAAPNGFKMVDVNGDGHPDAVVFSFNGPPSVLLGDGHGGFAPPVAVDAPYMYGNAIAQIADVNGDGRPDLVMAASDTTDLLTYFGNGDGTFTAGPSSPDMGRIGWLEVADLDGDGKPDALLQEALFQAPLRFARGLGDGTFAPPLDAPHTYVESPLFADLNGDGHLDFVNFGYPEDHPELATVHAYLGDGTGAFEPSLDSPDAVGSQPFLIADLDGDGIPDLATTNVTTGTVLLGRGDGTFRPGPSFHAVGGLWGNAVADLDLDGKPDLVFLGGSARQVLFVSSPQGRIEGTATFESTVPPLYQLAVADVDSDGRPDVVLIGNRVLYTLRNVTAGSCP